MRNKKSLWRQWREHCLRLEWTERLYYYNAILFTIMGILCFYLSPLGEDKMTQENYILWLRLSQVAPAIAALQWATILTYINNWQNKWYNKEGDNGKAL